MVGIISLLMVLYLSLFITRIATIILVHTGLSQEVARFQARSAMTGCGFTTSEAEHMLTHPVRRRVIMVLMLLGHIGVVASMSTAIIGFVQPMHHSNDFWWRTGILAMGLILLWILSKSKIFEKNFDYLLDRILKNFTSMKIYDFSHLCHLADNYKIIEMQALETDSFVGKPLRNSGIDELGVRLLGVESVDGNYNGSPDGELVIQANDVLILYGPQEALDQVGKAKPPPAKPTK